MADKTEQPKEAAKEATKKKSTRISSAAKRDKQHEKRRLANKGFKAAVKTAIRSYDESVVAGDKAHMQAHLKKVYSLIDKGVKTGCFHANKASRTKSRLSTKMKA